GRGGADADGPPRQARAFSVASVAAAGSCRRARRSERGTVGAGSEGVVLFGCPALVRRDAGCGDAAIGATARRAGRRGDPLRQRRGATAGATEAADRLLYLGADWLSVLDVSARLQCFVIRAPAWCLSHRWPAAGAPPAKCEGRHVHGGGSDLQGARP